MAPHSKLTLSDPQTVTGWPDYPTRTQGKATPGSVAISSKASKITSIASSVSMSPAVSDSDFTTTMFVTEVAGATLRFPLVLAKSGMSHLSSTALPPTTLVKVPRSTSTESLGSTSWFTYVWPPFALEPLTEAATVESTAATPTPTSPQASMEPNNDKFKSNLDAFFGSIEAAAEATSASLPQHPRATRLRLAVPKKRHVNDLPAQNAKDTDTDSGSEEDSSLDPALLEEGPGVESEFDIVGNIDVTAQDIANLQDGYRFETDLEMWSYLEQVRNVQQLIHVLNHSNLDEDIPKSINDIPGLVAYMNSKYGHDAFMIPSETNTIVDFLGVYSHFELQWDPEYYSDGSTTEDSLDVEGPMRVLVQEDENTSDLISNTEDGERLQDDPEYDSEFWTTADSTAEEEENARVPVRVNEHISDLITGMKDTLADYKEGHGSGYDSAADYTYNHGNDWDYELNNGTLVQSSGGEYKAGFDTAYTIGTVLLAVVAVVFMTATARLCYERRQERKLMKLRGRV